MGISVKPNSPEPIVAPVLQEALPTYPSTHVSSSNISSVSDVSEAKVVYGPLTKLDTEIQEITAEVKSAGIKYTLATLLPSFILKLWSKITGSEVLPDADHYANLISQQSTLLAAKYAQRYIPQLKGQKEDFLNETGKTLVNIGGKFFAGYVANQGWGEINKLADFYLDQMLGKGLMRMIVKPLASRMIANLQKDFEKRWDVKGLESSIENLSLSSVVEGSGEGDLDKEWVVAKGRGENYLANLL